MSIPRRTLLSLFMAAALPAAAAFPERPITIVVPFGPGSVSDAIARVLGKELEQRFGKPVVIDNRPGASGILAAQYVARASPDGYTLLLTGNTTHSANPWLFKRLPYDPVKDFSPIVLVGDIPYVLVTSTELPVKTTQQLIAYLKANPQKANYAFANSTSQVAGATFARLSGATSVAVSYKSSPQALVDVITGTVQYYFVDVPTALPQVRSGKIRPIAMADARTPLLPATPPLADAFAGFSLLSWNGIFTPAGTPDDVVSRLNNELRGALQEPKVHEQLSAMGLNVAGRGTPQEFQAYLNRELEKWGKWVKDSGITAE